MIDTAMILAAGKGTRMQSTPADPPKPLTEIAGQSLLMRMVARLEASGIKKIIINLQFVTRRNLPIKTLIMGQASFYLI